MAGLLSYHWVQTELRAVGMLATDLTPSFAGQTTKAEYYEALAQVFGERPGSTERLQRLLFDWLDRTMTGPVRFNNTSLPIEQRFLPPDTAAAQPALAQTTAGKPLGDGDIGALVRFVAWQVLAWHHDHRKAFPIAVGAEYFICDGKSILQFQRRGPARWRGRPTTLARSGST